MTTAQVALVTGASRGIGAIIARALLADGWRVGALARSTAGTAGTAELVEEFGPAVLPLAAQVTDAAAVQDAVRRVEQTFGPIALAVNNAGVIEPESPIWEADPDRWWQVLEVNVRGPFLVTRAVVPGMLAAGGGRVINLNSGAATRDSAELSGYTASKTALARVTGATHAAGADHGVFAFDLAPGHVRTDMTTSMRMHAGRTEWTDPKDVTDLVLAIAAGELDDWSGRMIRAGSDTPGALRAAADQGATASPAARTIGLIPWGPGDPLG